MKGCRWLVAIIILAFAAVGCSQGASHEQPTATETATATPNVATTQAQISIAIRTSQARSAIATKTRAAATVAPIAAAPSPAAPRVTAPSQATQVPANACPPNVTEYRETGVGRTAAFAFTIPRCHVAIIGGATVDGVGGVLRAIEGSGQQIEVTIVDGYYTIVPEAQGQAVWCQRLGEANSRVNVQPLPQWRGC
jgi:hypothetical protein